MHIVKKDFRKGTIKIRIDDPDDLWYLNTIIETGDLVKGKTTRKVRIGDGDNAKVTKKTLTLQIEVETVEFTSTSLRVNGKIKEGPEDIPRDSYHAISLEIKGEYTIHKDNWFSYHKQKLEEATSKKYNYLLCLLDREEAIFAITKKYGYKVLTKLKGTVPKKSREISGTKDFQKEIITQIEEYNTRFTPDAIIIASPAFYKDEISKRISNKEIKKKIVLAISSSVTERALDEVIKRPELASILKDSRARQEQMLVEELLSAIKKGNLASYGFEHVTEAVEAGAISTLLFTDKFIQKRKESGEFVDVEELLKKIDSLQGNIHIISSEHEGGKKLDGLGGIAALLRFKIH